MEAIKKAVELLGGPTEAARKLEVTPPAVTQWCAGHRPVPAPRCVQIECLTNGAVSRQDLRPNDWASFWPELTVVRAVSCSGGVHG